MANKVGYHNLVIDVATGIGTQATITVYDAGTVDLSTIYSDVGGTAESNPFTTDANGRFSFFADPAEYDIQVSGVGITTYTLEDVSIIWVFVQFVTSQPSSGEYRLKELRLNAGLNMIVTYPDIVEP